MAPWEPDVDPDERNTHWKPLPWIASDVTHRRHKHIRFVSERRGC